VVISPRVLASAMGPSLTLTEYEATESDWRGENDSFARGLAIAVMFYEGYWFRIRSLVSSRSLLRAARSRLPVKYLYRSYGQASP
jgi:hypothetical protein